MNVMSSKPRPKEGGVAAPHLFVVINREEGRKKQEEEEGVKMEQRQIRCGAPSHLVNLSSSLWLQSQLGCLRLLHQCHPIAAQSALLCCSLMIRSASSSSIGAPKIQLLLLQPSVEEPFVGMPRCLRLLPLQEETQFVFFFFICCRQRKQAFGALTKRHGVMIFLAFCT